MQGRRPEPEALNPSSPPRGLASLVHWVRETLRIVAARLRVHGYRWIGGTAIHPKCLIEADVRIDRPWLVRLGPRCVLQSSVWLSVGSSSARLQIGAHGFIGRGTQIEVSHEVAIGDGALIAPGVYITDHNHAMDPGIPMWQQPCRAAPVRIGSDVWIGTGAVILPGVSIGDGAVVAAGAVVNRDVRPGAIVAGVPAREVKHRG